MLMGSPPKAPVQASPAPGPHTPHALQNYPVDDFHVATTPLGFYAVDMDAKHRPAVNLVLRGREHEPEVVSFMCSQCGSGDVVQAGAFFGDMFPGLSRGLATDALVWSFEPNPRSHYLATQTLALNGIGNVRLIHAGLSDSAGSGELVMFGQDGRPLGGMSHLRDKGNTDKGNAGRTIHIDLVTIDDVVPDDRHVSIVQLDVEGHEMAALKGARETIRRCKPILILEFVDDPGELREQFPEVNDTPAGLLDRRNTVFIPRPSRNP